MAVAPDKSWREFYNRLFPTDKILFYTAVAKFVKVTKLIKLGKRIEKNARNRAEINDKSRGYQ
ncbi:hypothetical protein SMUG_15410 [Gallibacterium anatis]